ncbi:histidine kinase dimerization/phospho-acceptor domain-containing protein [Vibrio sp. NTOU-M3]|uniref:sensor histidine kinase n=1 Tax=Vibrio sp. NTOU-M3 TaxID=3234954 RepID=UPI00349F3988
MSFKTRLFVFTCLWFCLSSVLIAMTYNWQKETIEQRAQQSLHKELAIHMRDDNTLMIGTNYNPDALKSIFHTLMLIGPDFEIYFLDAQGKITTHAAPEDAVLSPSVDLIPIRRFLLDDPFPILGDDPRNPGEQKVFSVAAIEEFGSVIGYLYVVIGSSKHNAILQAEVDTPYVALIILFLVSIIGFAGTVYWLVQRNLLRPIERVTRKLQQQADQDFRLSPDFTRQVPELVPIAHQYHLMAKHIQQQFLQAEYQSNQQTESLLQLSHDLKTPLSSILGYLETWRLQQDTPDPLIEVAYRNSEKLSAHLNQLLQSAKRPTKSLSYRYERVDLCHVLHDVQETFEGQFRRRNLTLDTKIDTGLITIGDRMLLERALHNLLENALRHSPTESIVTLRVSLKDKDNIEFELTNPVWQDAPSGSLGIGSRIVQSILMLHHSYLQTSASKTQYRQRFVLRAAP